MNASKILLFVAKVCYWVTSYEEYASRIILVFKSTLLVFLLNKCGNVFFKKPHY
jgi:hypothetical protein